MIDTAKLLTIAVLVSLPAPPKDAGGEWCDVVSPGPDLREKAPREPVQPFTADQRTIA